MGVAGLFLLPRPQNLTRVSFQNAESLVMISSMIKELVKISANVPFISRD